MELTPEQLAANWAEFERIKKSLNSVPAEHLRENLIDNALGEENPRHEAEIRAAIGPVTVRRSKPFMDGYPPGVETL